MPKVQHYRNGRGSFEDGEGCNAYQRGTDEFMGYSGWVESLEL